MTETDQLSHAEQSFFEEIMAVILFLNKNGIPLNAVREMIDMKVDAAFKWYPKVSESYDRDFKNGR